MQTTFKKAVSTFISTIILTVVFVVLRSVMMTTNFDIDSGFFINKTPVTVLYLSLFVAIVIIFFISKSILILPKKQVKSDVIINALSALSFVFVSISFISEMSAETQINKIASGIAVVFAITSCVYYFSKIVSKNIFSAFLSVSPLVFFLSYLIDYFVRISGHANTYHLFPDFFSILALVYFLMANGKIEHLNTEKCPLFSVSLISLCAISFSTIPDIYLALSGIVPFTYFDVAISVFKLINLAIALRCAISIIYKVKEENK